MNIFSWKLERLMTEIFSTIIKCTFSFFTSSRHLARVLYASRGLLRLTKKTPIIQIVCPNGKRYKTSAFEITRIFLIISSKVKSATRNPEHKFIIQPLKKVVSLLIKSRIDWWLTQIMADLSCSKIFELRTSNVIPRKTFEMRLCNQLVNLKEKIEHRCSRNQTGM